MAVHENEVILAFLQAEARSSRFGSRYRGVPWDLIYRADLSDKTQNSERRKLLAKARGWGRNRLLFKNLAIGKFTWERKVLSGGDMSSLKYVNHPQPNAISNNSRKVSDGAANALGIHVPGWTEPICEILKALVQGMPQPPLILLREKAGAQLYLLEGHTRATAYAIRFASQATPLTVPLWGVECYIGTGPLGKWKNQRI